MTGWWPTVYHVVVLAIGLGLMRLFFRKSRKPRRGDAAKVIMLGLFTSAVLTGPFGEHWDGWRYPPPWMFVVLLLATIAGVLTAVSRDVEKTENQSTGCLAWAVCGFMCYVWFGLVIMPLNSSGRGATMRTQCRNKLKQIGLALHNYHDVYESLPAHQSGEPPHSWRVATLPFLDKSDLWEQYDFGSEWNQGSNAAVAKAAVREYECPAHRPPQRFGHYPSADYLAVVGDETLWPESGSTRYQDVLDGLSNTLMVVEACGTDIPWAEPRDLSFTETPLGINLPGKERYRSAGVISSYHSGGAQVLMGDGRVEFLSTDTDPEILRALLTADGGEPIDQDDF